MAFVQVEPPAFLVGEEGFNAETLAVELASILGRCHVADEIDRFLTVLPPPTEGEHGAVSFVGEPAVGCIGARAGLGVMGHVLKLKPLTFPAKAGVAGRAADILPHHLMKEALKPDAIELAIPQKNDMGFSRNQSGNLSDEADVSVFGEVPLFAFDHHPGNGQGALLLNQSDHESHTATSDGAPVHHQYQREM